MNVIRTLSLSLQQDIYFLNKLLQDISKVCGPIEIESWIIPSKPYSIVSQLTAKGSLKNASYESCLEVTLDRVYVVINFLLQYLNSSNNKVSKNLLVTQPRQPTLGLCLKLIWENIAELMEREAINQTTQIYEPQENTLADKECQTEIISMNTCDSCSSAIVCMKRLLKFFDDRQDKITIRYQIFDITQFGCMLKVTSSIEEALNNLYKRLNKEQSDKKILILEKEDLNNKLHDNVTKIALLEEEAAILKRQLDKGLQDIFTLTKERSILRENLATKQTESNSLKEMTENYNIRFQSITKQNNTLKNENSLFKSNLKKSTQMLSRCHKAIDGKLSKMDQEIDVMKSIIEQFEKSVAYLNVKLIKITKNIGKTELKLKSRFEDTTSQILQSFLKYERFCMKIKEVFKEKIDNFNENSSKEPETTIIKGNPLEDITKQIDENKNKIQELENENIRLKKLLDRFKNVTFK